MKAILAALSLAGASALFGQETSAPLHPGREYPALTLRDGTTYRGIRVLSLSETTLRISHQQGAVSIPLRELTPEDLQRTGISLVAEGGLSRVMTADERARTGISKLTPAEQKGLQDWIIRTAASYYEPPPSPPPKAVANLGKKTVIDNIPAKPQPSVRRAGRAWDLGAPLPSHGHSIIARYRDQHPKVIQLEDHSTWEVSPNESNTVLLWLPTEAISLLRGEHPDYPVAMVNINQGRSVNVRFRK